MDSLTAERVVALARTRASDVRFSEAEVVQARGRLARARGLGQENPTVEGVANTKESFERRTQWELNVPIGIGLGWAGRVGLAKAELGQAEHLLSDRRGKAIGAALAAYYRVLHASRRADLAAERSSVATELKRTATERHRSGDVARLELLLAETEELRAAGELRSEQQGLIRERIALAAILGLPSGEALPIQGALEDQSILERTIEQPSPARRDDILAAESELRAARAARRLANAELLPGLALRLNYGHEDGEVLVQPGVAVTVPLFQYGQDSRLIARGRQLRADTELERVRNASAAEAEGLKKIYESATAAAGQIFTLAIPRVLESEAMIRESYRAGKIDLPTFLVVRRDLLETRREYLDQLLEAATAGIDLAVATGRFR